MDNLEFDGKEYVSSKRAASITGYAKDYIGQLCRLGRLDGRMIGRNWYIERSTLENHRKLYKQELETLQHSRKESEAETVQESTLSTPPTSPKVKSRTEIPKIERYPRRVIEETVPLRYESDERPLLPPVESENKAVEVTQSESQVKPKSTFSIQRSHRSYSNRSYSNGRVPIVGAGEIIPDPFEIAQVEREMAMQQPISYKREDTDESQSSWSDADEDISNQDTRKRPHIAKLGFAVAVLLAAVLYSSIFVVEQRVYERTTENDYALVSSKLLNSYFK